MGRGCLIVDGRRLCIAAILWFACSVPTAVTQESSAAAPAGLRDLGAISELQSLFDRDSDKTPIVLLLSPT
jgi:hypothetical protein